MSAELVVLGAGSALPRAGYGCAGYALRPQSIGEGGPVTLLDCGPGSIRSLGGAGIELGDVRRVVFSHYHLDHCLDLFALFFARRNPGFEARRLELFGPLGLKRLVEETPRGLGRWATDPDVVVREIVVDEDGLGGFEADGLAFRCVWNGHDAEAVSWRVEQPGDWSLAYTGDTPPNPEVAELARGVDLLVAECSFADADATPNHLTPTSAATLARDAGARRLLLSHFYPTLDPAEAAAVAATVYGGPIEVARDGSRHRVHAGGG